MPSAKIQGGANTNPRGQPHIKGRESQLPGGAQSIPRRGESTPWAPPPEINFNFVADNPCRIHLCRRMNNLCF